MVLITDARTQITISNYCTFDYQNVILSRHTVDYLNLFKNHKGLLSTHLNIRSIWRKIDLLRTVFHDNNVDMITFSETWLTTDIPNELVNIEGYDLVRNDRSWSENPNSLYAKKGRGVCTYIRDSLKYKTNVLPELDVSNKDIECQTLEIIFENQKKLLVLNLYRPPNESVELFTNNIDAKYALSKRDVIILGDLNIDVFDKSSVDTKCINRLISGFGLTKLINSPTRYGATKNSCIDQIVTNSNHIYQTGVADLNISDHQLVYFVKKKNKDHPIKTTFEGRSYRNYNTHDMIHYLDLQDSLHKIVHYLKDKIGVVYFQCCVIFDTL